MKHIIKVFFLFIFMAGFTGRVFSKGDAESKQEVLLTKNPFLTGDELRKFKNTGFEEETYLSLSGIFYSSIPSSSYAIINGRVLRVNDVVDNKKVVEISSEQVVLEDFQNKRYVLGLKND